MFVHTFGLLNMHTEGCVYLQWLWPHSTPSRSILNSRPLKGVNATESLKWNQVKYPDISRERSRSSEVDKAALGERPILLGHIYTAYNTKTTSVFQPIAGQQKNTTRSAYIVTSGWRRYDVCQSPKAASILKDGTAIEENFLGWVQAYHCKQCLQLNWAIQQTTCLDMASEMRPWAVSYCCLGLLVRDSAWEKDRPWVSSLKAEDSPSDTPLMALLRSNPTVGSTILTSYQGLGRKTKVIAKTMTSAEELLRLPSTCNSSPCRHNWLFKSILSNHSINSHTLEVCSDLQLW